MVIGRARKFLNLSTEKFLLHFDWWISGIFCLITFISDFFGKLMNKYGQMLYTFELILGIVFLISLFHLVHNAKIKSFNHNACT